MIEIEVNNVATLIEAARRMLEGFGKAIYWFRGHACHDWTLVPSLHRQYDSPAERNLTGRFRMAAPTRCSRCPDIGDHPSWLSLMQHFRLPTRLLDWTGSLLAAVYFAVADDPKPGAGAVWALAPGQLNKASAFGVDGTFLVHGPEAKGLVDAAFTGAPSNDSVLAVLGQDVDLRMTIQQGTFTIHGDNRPLEQKSGADRFLGKFIIPESAKPTFEEELWVLGIRRSILFPDLDNLAKELASDWRIIPKVNQRDALPPYLKPDSKLGGSIVA